MSLKDILARTTISECSSIFIPLSAKDSKSLHNISANGWLFLWGIVSRVVKGPTRPRPSRVYRYPHIYQLCLGWAKALNKSALPRLLYLFQYFVGQLLSLVSIGITPKHSSMLFSCWPWMWAFILTFLGCIRLVDWAFLSL